MSGSAKVLITGIGCVGKSTLRRRVAEALGRKVVCIDRDDADSEPEFAPGQVLVIESVHGLDEPPESWGLIVYLLPPPGHNLRWIRRGLVWFRTGQVDRPPRALRRAWSLLNIPLIVRLVGRNVWDASRWVKDDRKRIEGLFSDHTVVTDDPDLAFREIKNFISRAYEKREDMAESEEITEETLQEWVRDSIELDLVYDEENIKLIPKSNNGDFNLNMLTQNEIFKSVDLKTKDFLFEKLAQKDKNKLFHNCYKYFKMMKKSRVFFGLTFDDVKKKNLDPCSEFKYEDVKKAAENRTRNLDRIMWNCAAAISTLRAWEIKGRSEKNARDTLIALFHSEICASATLDISWGHASGFSNVFLKEVGFDFAGYELFELIARHNTARGLNHQMLPKEAINKIDKFVDVYLNIQNDKKKPNNIEKKYIINKNDFYRVLIFPMTLTLTQALKDLRRYTEERYYLNQAYNFAKDQKNQDDFRHWRKLFKLNLAINNKDRGYSEKKSELNKKIENPRAENTRRTVKASFNESDSNRAFVKCWKESNSAKFECCKESNSAEFECWKGNNSAEFECWKEGYLAEIEKWKEDEISVLRWYSTEERPFGRHLETMSQSILLILNSLDNKNIDDPYTISKIKDYIKQVLNTVRGMIKKFGDLYFLVERNRDCKLIEKAKSRDFTHLWKQGKLLFRVLKIFRSQFKDNSFESWECNLKKLIKLPALEPFHSKASEVETLQESPKPTKIGGWCPRCKSRQCDRLCPVNRFLNNEPNSKDDFFASRDYYYDIMSARQKRFLSYIQERTGRDRFYQQGEALRPSPCFEIICLRRWNSFSPNLGSRASATVGGGYFVRAWDGEHDRYIGIVIDPGYNFLENLFNEGFTITDVDLVVITHAHPDHIENFTNLLTLLRERSKRLMEVDGLDSLTSPREHRILLAITEGVFERLKRSLDHENKFIRDIVVLTAKHDAEEREKHLIKRSSRGGQAGKMQLNLRLDDDHVCHMDLREAKSTEKKILSLRAVRAWHNDVTGYDTIGIVIEYQNCENDCKNDKCKKNRIESVNRGDRVNSKKVGIIGDSRYTLELYKDYEKCDVLVTHLGSLVDEDDYRDHPNKQNDNVSPDNKKLLELLAKKNHLYLPGIALLICDIQKKFKNGFPVTILSEFGEELRGGLRKDIAKRLSYFWKRGSQNPLPIIPGDVGLRIDIDRKEVFCCICHRYVEPKNISPETVLPDEESMAYVCSDCKELRGGELNTLLEEWCRTARPVVPLEPKESNDLNKATD